MATLGVKWKQTEEFARASLRTEMFNDDLTLPEKDFDHFKVFLLRRIGNMLKIYIDKPMFNNPMVRFLWVMFNRLDATQRKAIEDLDEGKVIEAWRQSVSCHVAELEYMAARSNWKHYWSVENYLRYVRGIENMDGVWLIDNDLALSIFLELASDPRRAYASNLAIQWTGDNMNDIHRYYGENFDLYKSGTDLVISTGAGPLTVKLGNWTWPDSADGIDGGDYAHLIKRKLEIGIGIWIKPGSTPLVPNV